MGVVLDWIGVEEGGGVVRGVCGGVVLDAGGSVLYLIIIYMFV